MLAGDFPHYSRVQRYFYARRDEPSPSAAIIDSEAVKTNVSGGPRGSDAGKKVKDRKRHIVTDTLGLLVGAAIHPDDVQDRVGAMLVIQDLHDLFPWLRHLFANGAYALCRAKPS
jgi:hypothetical protein